MALKFFVEGHPKAQPRARVTKHGTYTPTAAEGWRQRVASVAVKHRPDEPHLGPVHLTLRFIMPRPKDHFRANGNIKDRFLDSRHTHQPDLDNLEKAIKDELQQLGFYRNDSQVWHVEKRKVWELPAVGSRPGLDIEIGLQTC